MKFYRTHLGVIIGLTLTACTPKEVIREVQVPIKIPTLCTSECPISKEASSDETPKLNGDLADAWKERGSVIACYVGRLACVREMLENTSTKKDDPSKTAAQDAPKTKSSWWKSN